MKRTILHCDCNSFFASVETALDPSYKNVPMAVCGSEDNRHGIVLAKNELAKKYGIKTAETVWSAKRKCPSLVIAQPHYGEYLRYSKRVNDIYARYTDVIEPFGIDESWLDVTGSERLFGSGLQIAERIRNEVKKEIGITVSVGVSFNKVFAKLGSDYKKPDAVTVINEDNFKDIVYPLPCSDLLFIGQKTSEELSRLGIRTIGELAHVSRQLLISRFGKSGEMLYRYSRGEDDSPVIPQDEREDAKSVGSGYTFKRNLLGREEARVGIEFLSEDVATRLRRLSMKCRTVQLTIKDEYLRVIQRQAQIDPPSDIAKEISTLAYNILEKEWKSDAPIRMLTVTASNLTGSDMITEQLSFFSENNEEERNKNRKKEETVDNIRQRFGSAAILNGSFLETDIGITTPKSRKE